MNQKQAKALQALLTHPTRREAAAAAGIDETTLRRYLRTPEFQQAYREAFSDMVTDATRQAQQALSPAISALKEIVEDMEAGTASRISAARTLLEYGLRMTEFNDILRDLESVNDHVL